MSQTLLQVAAGATSTPLPIYQNQSICAGPALQGGSVSINIGPSQNGPFAPVASGSSAVSYRPNVNQWYTITALTQAGVALVSDMAVPGNVGQMVSLDVSIDSANATAEQQVFTFRIPPGVLPLSCRVTLAGRMSMTNNANAKTMQCRMGGLTGTLFHQSAALASLADYNFEASFAAKGDNATLQGFGAGSAGGFGTSATVYTSLATTYQTTETEVVVTVTKATGTDTMKLESLVVTIA